MQVEKYFGALGQLRKSDGRRYAVLSVNRGCNRDCSYCVEPSRWDPKNELTLVETTRNIDWLYNQGYRFLSVLGGEPLAESLYTKDGTSFYDYTLAVGSYASRKGFVTSLITNGDFLTKDKVRSLRKTGFAFITLSLHSFTRNGLDHLINGGRLAAEEGIIPTIQTVITSTNANSYPGIVAKTAGNGILSSATVLQENGGSFSVIPEGKSLIPSKEQWQIATTALRRLKDFGLVRNNRNFLSKSLNYYPNRWICGQKNYFIHIGAGGTLDVCQEVRTNLTIDDISGLDDEKWKKEKKERIENCAGCLYQCYFEAFNPDTVGDLATGAVSVLIRAGGSNFVRKWGQFAVEMSKKLEPDIDWSLNLN